MNEKEAKETLFRLGYQVDNLWCTDDVRGNYECTEYEAMEVLISALTNEATMSQIWYAIRFHAEENGLEPVKQ